MNNNQLDRDRFLKILAGNSLVTFQTFDDSDLKRKALARVFHGAAEDNFKNLQNLNDRGAGVFVMVNEGDGKGRKEENVIKVRSLYSDLDGSPLENITSGPLSPHIIVESSPGRYHAYWLVDNCPLDKFASTQKAIARRFDSDPSVHDLPRVMRLPGYHHRKKKPFLSRIIKVNDAPPYHVEQVIRELALNPETESCPRGVTKESFRNVPDGNRTNAITKAAGTLIRNGADLEEAITFCQKLNEDYSPPLDNKVVVETVTNIFKRDQKNQRQKNDESDSDSINKTIARLASLHPLEYERVRKTEAAALGIDRVAELDKAVKAARKIDVEEDNSMFPADDPWDSEIDGKQLITELAKTFERFSVLPKGSAITAALWTILTYCFDVWNTLPILGVISPEKRCGKTTFLTTLGSLCYRALPVSNISPAAVYRAIEVFRPTLVIDEGDTFLKKENEDLRGVINSGHTKAAAFVIRCDGDDNKPVRFSTWCPKAIAMIGTLPDTIQDRSITLHLRRKLPEEKTEHHGDGHAEDFRRLRSMILRWVDDNESALRLSTPERLDTKNDRQADNWLPLLAIAMVTNCIEKAQEAARLSIVDEQDEPPAKIQLLQDIRTVFEDSSMMRLSSAALVKALVDMEDRPWGEWKHGKPLTQATLSRLLRPFGIHSKTIRFSNELAKGYELESFKDTFKRYIPPIQSVTTLQDNNISKLCDIENVTRGDNVTPSNQPNQSISLECYGVMLSKGSAESVHGRNGIINETDELEDIDIEGVEVVNAG